ncbi:UNVERIFIED_CONTAM: hypothetical protein HDU68_011476 [Siphonaria sp. JEL0065]|nr:hypothetical protein HDU68_011476 [Siphonaria sp. JEL0065]
MEPFNHSSHYHSDYEGGYLFSEAGAHDHPNPLSLYPQGDESQSTSPEEAPPVTLALNDSLMWGGTDMPSLLGSEGFALSSSFEQNPSMGFMEFLTSNTTYDSSQWLEANQLSSPRRKNEIVTASSLLNSPKKSVTMKVPQSAALKLPKTKLSTDLKRSPDSIHNDNFARMTPSQIMGPQSQTPSLEETNFTHHRSTSWDHCESPLFPQPVASPFAFSSTIPSVSNTPTFSANTTAATTMSNGLSATFSNVQLNSTLFNQMLVSPALAPSPYQQPQQPPAVPLAPSSIMFSPSLLPASAWSSAGQLQYQQSLRKSPSMNGAYSSPPSALGPNRALGLNGAKFMGDVALSSFSSTSSLASAEALETTKKQKKPTTKRIKKVPSILTPEEEQKIKIGRKEAEKQRRDAIKNGLDELKVLLPGSRLPEKAATQTVVLEKVYDYVLELQKEHQEKLQTVKDLELEIEAAKKLKS